MQITKYLIESIGPYTKVLPKKNIYFHFISIQRIQTKRNLHKY